MSDKYLDIKDLVDGKFYKFSLDGRACAGVFIMALAGDKEEDGFYCNGVEICHVADAQQILSLSEEREALHRYNPAVLTMPDFDAEYLSRVTNARAEIDAVMQRYGFEGIRTEAGNSKACKTLRDAFRHDVLTKYRP